MRKPPLLASASPRSLALLLLLLLSTPSHSLETFRSESSKAGSGNGAGSGSDKCQNSFDCNRPKCEACYCSKPHNGNNHCSCASGWGGEKCENFCEKGCYPYWQWGAGGGQGEWQKWFQPHDQGKGGILNPPQNTEHFNAWPSTFGGYGGP